MKPAIADGHVVTIHYKHTLDDGSVADQSLGGEPLVYLHGAQNIVPGLERQLAGRKVGDKVDCVVPANEGYGEYDPAAEQAVPRCFSSATAASIAACSPLPTSGSSNVILGMTCA
ncbi:MAG: peptidylprolyl isomerase, partial [Planctomycetota bacterium]